MSWVEAAGFLLVGAGLGAGLMLWVWHRVDVRAGWESERLAREIAGHLQKQPDLEDLFDELVAEKKAPGVISPASGTPGTNQKEG